MELEQIRTISSQDNEIFYSFYLNVSNAEPVLIAANSSQRDAFINEFGISEIGSIDLQVCADGVIAVRVYLNELTC